jgi:hypothetical protein
MPVIRPIPPPTGPGTFLTWKDVIREDRISEVAVASMRVGGVRGALREADQQTRERALAAIEEALRGRVLDGEGGSPEVSCSSPAAPDNVTAVDGNRQWRYRTVSEPFSARLRDAEIRLWQERRPAGRAGDLATRLVTKRAVNERRNPRITPTRRG